MKQSFLLIELIFVIVLLSILSSFFIPKKINNDLVYASKTILLYLKQVRYKALIDDKYNLNNKLWHKQRWTLKFFRCKKSIGGLYYVIYSDTNNTGHPNQNESLKDALSSKYIYSSNYCKANNKNSKYVLLTQEFGISNVKLSCNKTSSLGQISFGNDGKIYSRLSNKENEYDKYEIIKSCTLKLYHTNGTYKNIYLEPKTSFVF